MAVQKATPPRHSRRVEAWVYSVLNPLLDSIRRELLLLGRGDLTWRAYSKGFEYIKPIKEYFDPSQLPNLEDFLADPLNPGFASEFAAHDRAVDETSSRARQFYDGLINTVLFRRQVEEAARKYQADPRNALKPLNLGKDDLPHYVAEYLINKTEELPGYYVTHGFWKEKNDQFLHPADEFEAYKQRNSFRALQRQVTKLRSTSENLVEHLERHRRDLCTKFDIPAAPIPSNLPRERDRDDVSSYIPRRA